MSNKTAIGFLEHNINESKTALMRLEDSKVELEERLAGINAKIKSVNVQIKEVEGTIDTLQPV